MDPEDISSESHGDVEMADGIWTYSPDPLPPNLQSDHSLSRLHSDAIFRLGELNNLEAWLENPQIVLSPLIHREAADSSDIETIARVTIHDIYREEAGESPGKTERERREFAEAANYVQAIRTGIERVEDGEEINIELICDLHETLLSGVRGEYKNPGELRDILVGVDEEGTQLPDARFVPMAPAQIPYALRDLLEYVRSGGEYPDLIDIALIHYQFETIHPFRDGNGRLGRLLIMLTLYDWGRLSGPYLYPSAYFNTNREEYYNKLLQVGRNGEWRDWVEFFLTAIEKQATDALSVAKQLDNLRQKYRSDYEKAGPVINELVDFIVEQPYFSEPQAVDALRRSQPAVNSAIHTLWDDGVIEETTDKETHRRYQANEVLEIVAPYST